MVAEDAGLWRALQPLRSVAVWLMTGAHPDDEWSGFLAWLAYARGVRTLYASTTRGEGGQNALGPERGRMLAALRSREMELAAREIGLAVRWLGAGPAHGLRDPMIDFGFSRSGEDTRRRWGAAALRARLVRLIRTERPDAMSPTFLDVPGQHGHHQAITAATRDAIALAADPAFVLPGCYLPAWQVAKFYLPAFSGAGGSYDDELPPPPLTVAVDLGEHCEALGLNWAQIGERSRRWHASQGMGRDLPDGPRRFGLHLAAGIPDRTLPMDGLAHRLGDLAGLLPAGPAARMLRAADIEIDAALAAFPRRAETAGAAHRALALLRTLLLPAGADAIAHRVTVKRRQLAIAAAQALGISADMTYVPEKLRAGGIARLSVRVHGPATAKPRLAEDWRLTVQPDGAYELGIPAAATPFGSLRDGWDPLYADEPVGVTLHWSHAGTSATLDCDPPRPLALGPATDVSLTPRATVRRIDSTTPVVLCLTGAEPPSSWPVTDRAGNRITLAVPPGHHDFAAPGLRLDWCGTAQSGPVAIAAPAIARVLRTSIAIDAEARVGVIAGGSDETLGWLRQLDIAAEAVDDAMLAGDLARFDVLLVGIFGFGQRPALLAQRDRLMVWVMAGGSLVTLYHRPADGWQEGRTPPLHLEIGAPSLRWRVTDPTAAVHLLAPDHRLLSSPNVIATADWDGWVRERGLYFARTWDPAYTALLALADPGQTPLRGALLAAPVGKGRHTHVALALHHQFAALVPGAFRLLANLVARPDRPGARYQSAKFWKSQNLR